VGDSSQPVSSLEGITLAGKYLLLRQLGEGGMCTVYEAEHVGLRQGLAIKVLKPELANDEGCVERFESEARAAAQLRSPNVARVYDVDWLPTGQPYITMELLVGHDLGGELARIGRLPIDLAVDYVRQACSGISEAHALGIVHRDLKPENLFLTDLGELTDRKLVKILDFGIAKDISDKARRLTAPDAVFGTVDYMSPEQIRSASKVDHRTDLWSLGVILYELLTGRTPYNGDARAVIAQIVSDPIKPPTTFVPELPPSLVATVMKALHKDPSKRFQSADELRAALEGYCDFEPITAVVARLPPQSVPRRSMRPSGSISVPPESMRDARTHASWETKSDRKRGKTWLLMPVTAMLLGAAVGTLVYLGQPVPWISKVRAVTPVAPAAPPPPSPASQAPAAPTIAPAASAAPTPAAAASVPVTAPSATVVPVVMAPATPPEAVIDSGTTVAAAVPTKKPGRPRATAHPPAPPPPSPPAADSAPPRLPKHL
jgi:serine/threonine-protein kinase